MEEHLGCDFCKFVNYESSDDFYLYELGTNKCDPLYTYDHLVYRRTIIHFVIKGKGTVLINNKTFAVNAHQAFIIPEGVHVTYCADEYNPWEYIWFHIGGPKFPQILKEAGLSVENPVFIPTKCADKIEALAKDILDHYTREYYCIGNLYKISDYMVTYSSTKAHRDVNASLMYVKKAIAYIQLKYSEQIKIEKIAFACGLNRSYLTRLFKDATGYSLQEYLLIYRMKMASKLLLDTEMSIQDIANAVGYSDTFTFSKAFKRQTGLSPSEYKSTK